MPARAASPGDVRPVAPRKLAVVLSRRGNLPAPVAPIAKGRVSVLHKGLARAIAWLSKLIAVVVAIVIVASIFAVVDDARTALSVRQPHAANR